MRLINLSLNTQAQKSPYPVMLNIISLPFTFFFSWNIESVQYTYKKRGERLRILLFEFILK